MKVKELKEKLANLDDNSVVYLGVDKKLKKIDEITSGVLNSVVIAAEDVADILDAERTLVHTVMANNESALNSNAGRAILRALGEERYNEIIATVQADREVSLKQQQEDRVIVDEIAETLNNQVELVEDVPKKVTKKVSKKVSKKVTTESEQLTLESQEAPQQPNEEQEAETILVHYYTTGQGDLAKVKAAKVTLGDDKAREIFNKTRAQ